MQSKTMMSHLPLAIVLTAGVLACASASGSGASSRPDRVETVTIESQNSSQSIALRPDLSGFRASLELAADKVWGALATAYSALPIPITALDSAHRAISGSAVAYRSFLRRPLSQFVDCGTTIVGPSADSYNVRINIQSVVDSLTPATSSLLTRVEATGSSSGGTIRCTSSGALEDLITNQVKELLGYQR